MRILLSSLFIFISFALSAQAQNNPPITLNVKNIEIVSNYIPTENNNIDTSMNPSPKDLIAQWIQKSFFANQKSSNIAKFNIKNAAITESYIKSESFFGNDIIKYIANFILEFEIIGDDNKLKARAITKSWGTRTISAETTIEERENIVHEMALKLLENLAQQTDKEIKNGFKEYINK